MGNLVIKDHASPSEYSEEEEVLMVGTPQTYTSHSYHGSAFSGDESFESLTLNKVRAHSIHVPIPTSEKQIASQPRPFNSFMAELRKDYQDEEDEKSEQKKREKRRQKMILIVKKSKAVSLNSGIGTTPTVTQSMSTATANSVDAAISPGKGGHV